MTKKILLSPHFYICLAWAGILLFVSLPAEDTADQRVMVDEITEEDTSHRDTAASQQAADTEMPESEVSAQGSSKTGSPPGKTTQVHKKDINTATKAELMNVRGIGEVIAGRIIAYREEMEGFNSLKEVMEVRGVGSVTYGRIQELFYFNGNGD
ncbi:MAG: ComEA family DNA-binding protein [Fibrobacterota bacterium]